MSGHSSTSVRTPSPVAPPIVSAPRPLSGSTQIAGWVVGGIGLATVAAGIAIAVEGQSQHNEALAIFNAGDCAVTACSLSTSSAAAAEESASTTTKTEGYATIGVGGGVALIGLIVLLTAPSHPKTRASTLHFQPSITKTGAGAGFSMEW